jgi:adenylate cyclase
MHDPPRILIADDNEANRDILATRLKTQGYELYEAVDGEQAMSAARTLLPDLILLDVMMPKLNGFVVCRRLKSDTALPFMPIILVTSLGDTKDVVAGLDAGADEFLTKPVDHTALMARVRSVLRIKSLQDRVMAQAADLADWNRTLEKRVAEQVAEIERVGRLKRFLPSQIAKLVVSSGQERMLESHRRDVTVLFCDLRGFTTFSETSEPEDVVGVLREYHTVLGRLVDKFEGTVERFTGDGLLVIFNDPLPCSDPCIRAVRMALEMRDEVGHDVGFGIGIAHGYATLGTIGYEGQFQYSVTGKVANLASRLCDRAKDGQILVDINVHSAVEMLTIAEFTEELALKGFSRPMKIFNVRNLRT